MPPHRGLYQIDSALVAAWVLLEFTNGSADRAREVIAAIGKMKIPPRKRREAEVIDLLLMAHSLRHHERSDTAAIRRLINLLYKLDRRTTDDKVRTLNYWLEKRFKSKTLEEFARAQSYKYIFEPPDEFIGDFGIK